MSSLVIVRVRIVSSASAGKATMVLVAMTLANAMILVDQTAVPIALPDMRAAHRIYERLGFRRVPGRDWSPVPGIDLLTFVFNAR